MSRRRVLGPSNLVPFCPPTALVLVNPDRFVLSLFLVSLSLSLVQDHRMRAKTGPGIHTSRKSKRKRPNLTNFTTMEEMVQSTIRDPTQPLLPPPPPPPPPLGTMLPG